MDTNTFLAAITNESERLAQLTAPALDQSIDFLDWTAQELVAHLGAVYSMALANLTAATTEATPPGDEAQAPEGDAIVAWFAERRATLIATLHAANDDAIAWTFAGVKTVGWWKRRLAQETAMHRWDVDAAISGISQAVPIEGDLATDGIDEYIDVSLRHSMRRPNRIYPAESLHLHRTDGPGEWMLVSDGAGGVTATHEHGKGDAAVRGTASELLLWVWGRPTSDIEIFGDEAAAAEWRALAP